MLIKFKNKMTMAIIDMITKGKAHGGLPSHIEISAEEATQIIDEINSLRSLKETQHNRYKFTTSGIDARLSLLSKELSKEEKLQILADWTAGKLTITFDSVVLSVVLVSNANQKYHD